MVVVQRAQDGWTVLPDGFWKKDDGLQYVGWNGEGGLHCLHGALHLYTDNKVERKRRRDAVVGLIDGMRNELQHGYRPLVVTEGTSPQKRARIEASPYLSTCLKRLSAVSGDLVTFGFGFGNNDMHILEALADSNIERIFVGVRPDLDGERTLERARSIVQLRDELNHASILTWPELAVEAYDAQTAEPWTRPPPLHLSG